jgi:hypothetical protein
MPIIGCKFCLRSHGDLFLCEPARAILESYEGEFELVRSIVVEAATTPIGDVAWPALVFVARDYAGQPLKKWLFPGDVDMLRTMCRTVQRMTELAIKKARG